MSNPRTSGRLRKAAQPSLQQQEAAAATSTQAMTTASRNSTNSTFKTPLQPQQANMTPHLTTKIRASCDGEAPLINTCGKIIIKQTSATELTKDNKNTNFPSPPRSSLPFQNQSSISPQSSTTSIINLANTPENNENFLTPLSVIHTTNKKRLASPNNTQDSSKRPHTETNTHVKKFHKLFIDTTDMPIHINFQNLSKLLKTNKHSQLIEHIKRTDDHKGYILTFKSQAQAQLFKAEKFNNYLDNAHIRDTQKSNNRTQQQQRTDILIHNIDPNIPTDEIHEDIEENYNIKIHSTYRLTRQSQEHPGNRYNTYTVKITIDTKDEHNFTSNIKLFTFNTHRTSRPTPPPIIMQCMKCFLFSHNTAQCTQSQKLCIKCHQPHSSETCNQDITCIHCGQKHSSRYKNCPTYKSIQQKEQENQKQQRNYANVTKNQQTIQEPPQVHHMRPTQTQPLQGKQIRSLLPTPQRKPHKPTIFPFPTQNFEPTHPIIAQNIPHYGPRQPSTPQQKQTTSNDILIQQILQGLIRIIEQLTHLTNTITAYQTAANSCL